MNNNGFPMMVTTNRLMACKDEVALAVEALYPLGKNTNVKGAIIIRIVLTANARGATVLETLLRLEFFMFVLLI